VVAPLGCHENGRFFSKNSTRKLLAKTPIFQSQNCKIYFLPLSPLFINNIQISAAAAEFSIPTKKTWGGLALPPSYIC
jgi:hypothetical protein